MATETEEYESILGPEKDLHMAALQLVQELAKQDMAPCRIAALLGAAGALAREGSAYSIERIKRSRTEYLTWLDGVVDRARVVGELQSERSRESHGD